MADASPLAAPPGIPDVGAKAHRDVQTESLDTTKRMFEAHPYLHFAAPGASIEILELLSMPGM